MLQSIAEWILTPLFKNLVPIFMPICAKLSHVYCRLAGLTGAFKITLKNMKKQLWHAVI